jgi:hypothetical protein
VRRRRSDVLPWSILHRVEVAFRRACLCWRGSISSRHYVKHWLAGVAVLWSCVEVVTARACETCYSLFTSSHRFTWDLVFT